LINFNNKSYFILNFTIIMSFSPRHAMIQSKNTDMQ
jgi:hypothetical protein